MPCLASSSPQSNHARSVSSTNSPLKKPSPLLHFAALSLALSTHARRDALPVGRAMDGRWYGETAKGAC